MNKFELIEALETAIAEDNAEMLKAAIIEALEYLNN